MELSVVRIHKAAASDGRAWLRTRAVVHPDKYLSQCPFISLDEDSHPPCSEFAIRCQDGVVAMSLVLEGSMAQTDGAGTRWQLDPGDADFSTGRGGVVRAETSGEQGVRFLHLWVDMPASLAPRAPRRQVVRRAESHGISFGDASVLLYAGSLGSAVGPHESPWPLTIADVSLPAGARAALPLASTERSFAVVLAGAVELGRSQVRLNRGNVAWVERTITPPDVNTLTARAVASTRILLVSSPVIGDRAGAIAGATECVVDAATARTVARLQG